MIRSSLIKDQTEAEGGEDDLEKCHGHALNGLIQGEEGRGRGKSV
jgi:hypothetical protein